MLTPIDLHTAMDHPAQRRRIPKILHQTGRTTTLSYQQVKWRSTWSYHNPQYELRFYDDAGCHDFVAHEYPGACSRLRGPLAPPPHRAAGGLGATAPPLSC
jgi:mannosyltransferase OCH1-like enzyme